MQNRPASSVRNRVQGFLVVVLVHQSLLVHRLPFYPVLFQALHKSRMLAPKTRLEIAKNSPVNEALIKAFHKDNLEVYLR